MDFSPDFDSLPPPDPLQFRDGVGVRGFPAVWSTNLDDEDLKVALEVVERKGVFNRPCGIGMALVIEEFDFADGAILLTLIGNTHGVLVYRSWEQWARYEAHLERVAQAERRQQRKRQVIKDNYERLFTEAGELWHAAEFDAAVRRLHLAEALRVENPDFQQQRDPRPVLLRLYTCLPTPQAGLDYLGTREAPWDDYAAFAHEYGWKRGDDAIQVLWTAIDRFPSEPQLYKTLALLASGGMKRFDVAIAACQRAIAMGLTDDTRSGFEGRLRRLLNKAAREGLSMLKSHKSSG